MTEIYRPEYEDNHSLRACAPDMTYYDDLIEWANKYQTGLVQVLGAGGVANVIMNHLHLISNTIRRYESKKDWELTNARIDHH